MRIIFAAIFLLILAQNISFAASNNSCSIPLTHSAHIEDSIDPDDPIIPIAVVQAFEITNSIAATAGALANVGTMQIVQHARLTALLKIVSCKNDFAPDDEAPAWLESPTQLSIGDGIHQHDLGTVIGNWALQGGIAIIWAGTNAYLKQHKINSRFPGGLALPAMILIGPTTKAAFNLSHYSTNAERGAGFMALAAEAVASGTVALLLHPSFFKARWSERREKWVDVKRTEPFVKPYGIIFEDYNQNAYWFLLVDTAMSMATGVLQSYQETEVECKRIVSSAAALSIAYALTFAKLQPNTEHKDLIIFGVIAGVQAVATTLQAFALLVLPEDTQEKTKAAAQSILLAAESALSLKTFYDVGSNIKSAAQYLCSRWQTQQSEESVQELQRVLTSAPKQQSSPRSTSPPKTIEELVKELYKNGAHKRRHGGKK
ncbi:MAG: hypothetical protein JKY15_05475 [Deltaproteobacteria bacterium]|nr:hypothetical protein [Deltaproteobacteria bacterium]